MNDVVAIRLWVALALGAAVGGGAGGCASAPPESFYTLSSGVREAAVTGGRRPAFERAIVVEPAAVPEIVDRPQLITVVDANRVAILEQQRWAEPLRHGISRVVAEGLARSLGTWRVSSRDDVIQHPDCRVTLDVRRFEAHTASATVDVQAFWTIACDGEDSRSGESVAHEPIRGAPSPTFGAIVAAEGRALGSVSQDLARAFVDAAGPVADAR